MKIDRVKLTLQFETMTDKKWIGLEAEIDDGESADTALTRLKGIIEGWAKFSSPAFPDNSIPPGPSAELPVINKAEERLGILIENATTKEELMNYKNDANTPYLAELFSSKLTQLAYSQ